MGYRERTCVEVEKVAGLASSFQRKRCFTRRKISYFSNFYCVYMIILTQDKLRELYLHLQLIFIEKHYLRINESHCHVWIQIIIKL